MVVQHLVVPRVHNPNPNLLYYVLLIVQIYLNSIGFVKFSHSVFVCVCVCVYVCAGVCVCVHALCVCVCVC